MALMTGRDKLREHSLELLEAYYSPDVPSFRELLGITPAESDEFVEIVEQLVCEYFFEIREDLPCAKQELCGWKLTSKGMVNV